MKWRKLGLVFSVNRNSEWMSSHASLPVPMHLDKNCYRVFFSTRDVLQRSHGGFVDIEIIRNDFRVLAISDKPVILPGQLGYFDDSGVSLSCYLQKENLFYYMGWNLLKTVPFSNKIGLSKFDRYCSKLVKCFNIPIIPICENEPLSFGYPFVLKIRNGYRMWYDTILSWDDSKTAYSNDLKSAVSNNGIDWVKEMNVVIPRSRSESGIARPCVIHDTTKYLMWYSIENNKRYRIGYAESLDGIHWVRKDEVVGITTSDSGWDSEQICYPYVFKHNKNKYMLYNGNGYGKTGFGLAVLEVE